MLAMAYFTSFYFTHPCNLTLLLFSQRVGQHIPDVSPAFKWPPTRPECVVSKAATGQQVSGCLAPPLISPALIFIQGEPQANHWVPEVSPEVTTHRAAQAFWMLCSDNAEPYWTGITKEAWTYRLKCQPECPIITCLSFKKLQSS